MATHKITMIALMAGVVFGAAATEGFNVYRRSHDSQSFEQRVHCKAVADAYVKEHTDLTDNSDTGTSVTVDKADYSPARNSCVAEVETTTYFRGGFVTYERVQDLLSGETLFTASESQIGSGSNAKRTGLDLDIVQFRFLPRVWDYVLNNADEPVALGKEYSQLESDLAPKSETPSVTQWDAKGNPIPDSNKQPPDFIPDVAVKEYDAQGEPIASSQQKIYLDPNTGEPIRASKSAPKSATGDKWDKYAVPSLKSPHQSAPPSRP